ncbi:hypothetical protein TWF481_005930 [Arthrobotrys musiformis]|uniref:Allergen n=1 Tax=Arthrobotrys musiformis TaxID=47236 RepID=A0AAV9WF64_9PEZI
MQAAKKAVTEFLHHGNKHSVDIEQETKPAVLHERVLERQHETVTHAVDREIHQHHHQIHVQPIQDRVVETEQHHHNVIPVEHRTRHHGKDREIATALATEHGKFKDEREILPVETTNSTNVVVGEHVHHHIHDYIQPVIERERVVPHVVHTMVPIHEHIEHEPYIHKGNVLPVMTLEEFTKNGFSLGGNKKPLEHIDYQGDPLEIDGNSHVGFTRSGEHSGGAAAGIATAGIAAAGTGVAAEKAYTLSSKKNHDRRASMVSTSSSSDGEKERRIPRSLSMSSSKKKNKSKESSSPRKHSWLDKLNPRVETTNGV